MPDSGTRPSALRRWLPLAVIVAAFVVLSTAYNLRVPVYEAADEHLHARYVAILTEHGTLPSFEETYEAWQPPLYYALGAGTLKLFGLDVPEPAVGNPRWPAATEAFRHQDEGFPYRQPVLSVHLLRGIGTLFGAGVIVFTYLIALLIFPYRRLLAAAAAASTALLPQFAFIAATVSNDAAAVFFGAAIIYFGLRYLRDAHPRDFAAAAIAAALAALTKSTAAIAIVVPLFALAAAPLSPREKLARLAALGLLPVAVAGWFYVRSLVMWGDFFPGDRFPGVPHPIWDPVYRDVFIHSIRESYWYAGGYTNVRLSPAVYDVMDALSVLALAGLIVTCLGGQLSRFQRQSLVLLALLPPLAIAGILHHSIVYDFQAQGRYLFVAQPALALLLPLGLGALFARDRLRDNAAVLALPAVLLALNVYIFAITLPRAY